LRYTGQNCSGITRPPTPTRSFHESFRTADQDRAQAAAVDPNTGKDFVAGKSVKNIKFDGDDVSFDIELGYPAKTQIDTIRKQVIAAPCAACRASATFRPTSTRRSSPTPCRWASSWCPA
jgi:hypothetical protein